VEREETIRRQFGRVAAAYGTSPIFAQGHDLALMVECATLAPAMTVLDIGCAAGHTAFAFAPHVREVVGVDLSPEMLAEAERQAAARNLTNIRFEVASALALPYADGQFDIVTCRLVAHHLPALPPALAEMARVLKPGGQLIIVDIVSPEDPALADFINHVEVLRDPSHSKDWTLSEWGTAGTEAGTPFAVIAEWRLPLDFTDWTARQQTPPERVKELGQVMDTATPEARDAFAITATPQRAFHLWAALLRGVKVP
jgi:SAM-dependent methyltransferase